MPGDERSNGGAAVYHPGRHVGEDRKIVDFTIQA